MVHEIGGALYMHVYSKGRSRGHDDCYLAYSS